MAGFWSWLIGEEPNQTQEYAAYDTSLASAHTVVTVTVDELHADAAMGFLNQHRPRDIHEQASANSETYQTGTAAYPAARTTSTSGATGGKQEEVIPLARKSCRSASAPSIAERPVVRKDVTERTETMRDDVRREQVEVQDAKQRRS